jgi:hypothetical protein
VLFGELVTELHRLAKSIVEELFCNGIH